MWLLGDVVAGAQMQRRRDLLKAPLSSEQSNVGIPSDSLLEKEVFVQGLVELSVLRC